MINAFPFLLGPLESPAQGNGQTGGVGLEQISGKNIERQSQKNACVLVYQRLP